MANQETMEAIEATIDIIEEVPSKLKNNWGLVVGVGIVAGSTAFYLGYRLGVKNATLKFEDVLESEVKATKDYYARLNKRDDFETPAQAVEVLLAKATNAETDAVVEKTVTQVVNKYHGRPLTDINEDVTKQSDLRVAEVVKELVTSIFDGVDPEWDYDQEISKRQANPQDPYIISKEEFLEAEPGYNQSTITFYEDDSVLADERDKVIDDVDTVVGEDNLERFGHGSQDPNVVYIRNDSLELDMEIVRSNGSFAQEVLGFIKHSDERRIQRRFRGGDE